MGLFCFLGFLPTAAKTPAAAPAPVKSIKKSIKPSSRKESTPFDWGTSGGTSFNIRGFSNIRGFERMSESYVW